MARLCQVLIITSCASFEMNVIHSLAKLSQPWSYLSSKVLLKQSFSCVGKPGLQHKNSFPGIELNYFLTNDFFLIVNLNFLSIES